MIRHPNIDPVAVDLGFVQIHWYGLMYLLAFAFGFWICRKYAREGRIALSVEQVEDAIFWGAVGVIVGGRLGYVFFYEFGKFLDNPVWLFKVWQGGMSFHGGLIGVITAAVLFGKKHKLSFGSLCDAAAITVPMGLGFGRIGNFIGQELYGRETDVPWAMIFPKDPLGLSRHPSQLYQAFMEGFLLFFVIYLFTRKPRPEYSVGALFLIGYGCARFTAEFFRQPDAHIGFDFFGWLTRGQLLSIPMIIIGCIVMVWAFRRESQSNV